MAGFLIEIWCFTDGARLFGFGLGLFWLRIFYIKLIEGVEKFLTGFGFGEFV